MYTSAVTDVATLVLALGVFSVSLAGAIVTVITGVRAAGKDRVLQASVEAVHDELRTLNGSTVGDLADADETRRIAQIPAADRTAAEDEHIATVPDPPQQGAPP